jgi:hypothetical protein
MALRVMPGVGAGGVEVEAEVEVEYRPWAPGLRL